MSRFSKKIIIPISIIVIGVTLLSVFLNSFFLERYYLYKQKKKINIIYEQLMENKEIEAEKRIEMIESKNAVTIINFPFIDDGLKFNEEMWTLFQKKHLSFIKLWLYEGAFDALVENGEITQIYNQGKLKYSMLVKYGLVDGQVYVIAMNIPHMGEFVPIINSTTLIIFSFAIVFILLFIIVITKRITKPLLELTEATKELSLLRFQTLEIHTNDEIEELAASFNVMSDKLKIAQNYLEEKNQNMKELLSNVSHEVKTPVALIKAYACGIQDGMDDGTFLNEIIQQNERINLMVQDLLQLSHMQLKRLSVERFNLSELITQIITECSIILDYETILWQENIKDSIYVEADHEDIRCVFNNLITNAVKYAHNFIYIDLYQKEDTITFTLNNGMKADHNLDTNQIWEPFYVGAKSRNRLISGNGLGMPMVKAILEKHEFDYDCSIEDNVFRFSIKIKNAKSTIMEESTNIFEET